MDKNEGFGTRKTFENAVMDLAGDNPGAVVALVEMCSVGGDASGKMDWRGVLGQMESDGIRGQRVWMFYKDVCGQSPERASEILEARRSGEIARDQLGHAIDNRGAGLPPSKLGSPSAHDTCGPLPKAAPAPSGERPETGLRL